MAKEKTSTRALTGSRIMHKNIPSTICQEVDGGFIATNGWETLLNNVLYYETYFDLSAYELDDLTVVPTALTLQDGVPYTAILPPAPGDPDYRLVVLDIISQEKLDVEQIYTNYTTSYDIPGSPASKEDWTQLLMLNFRLMTLQTDFSAATLLLPATSGSFGSAEPTAVQKLWLYRIIMPGANDLSETVCTIPPTRFVMGAEIVQEDELPYMMRLKRSYELATQG